MYSIFSSDFENTKKSQKILILGPYKPESARKRLIKLRDYLRTHGYKSAKRVADFPDTPKYDKDPDKHFTLKSRDKIKNWADVLVFVFMRDANNLGVWGELQFTIDFVKEKIHYSIELHEEGADLSTQTRGPLKISRMDSYEFDNDQRLCKLSVAFCQNVAYEFLWS